MQGAAPSVQLQQSTFQQASGGFPANANNMNITHGAAGPVGFNTSPVPASSTTFTPVNAGAGFAGLSATSTSVAGAGASHLVDINGAGATNFAGVVHQAGASSSPSPHEGTVYFASPSGAQEDDEWGDFGEENVVATGQLVEVKTGAAVWDAFADLQPQDSATAPPKQPP
eukprot:GSA25T00010637001.1